MRKTSFIFVVLTCTLYLNSCRYSQGHKAVDLSEGPTQEETDDSCRWDDVDMGKYVIAPLTPSLLAKLGGSNSLPSYQLYLSESISLSRSKSSGRNGEGTGGSIKMINDKYIIEIDRDTPGALKRINNGYWYEVLFDETEQSFLVFSLDEVPGAKERLFTLRTSTGDLLLNGGEVKYEENYWKVEHGGSEIEKRPVILTLHLDKDVYERLHSKKAKGRIIDSSK